MTHRRRATGVVLAGLLACEGEPSDPAPTESPTALGTSPASPASGSPDHEPGPPPAPGAFALPGLREWAPKDRLAWPTESVHITSSYGWRVDPVTGLGTRLHRGLDLRGVPGDLVMSIGAGTVAFVGHDPLLGNLVIVDHGDGLESFYGHLSDVLVVADAPVERGAAIGLVGNTGRSAAPHLHLSIRLDGVSIDPLEVLGEPQHRPSAAATRLSDLEPSPEPTPQPKLEQAAPAPLGPVPPPGPAPP